MRPPIGGSQRQVRKDRHQTDLQVLEAKVQVLILPPLPCRTWTNHFLSLRTLVPRLYLRAWILLVRYFPALINDGFTSSGLFQISARKQRCAKPESWGKTWRGTSAGPEETRRGAGRAQGCSQSPPGAINRFGTWTNF